ncbi:hypothetical protein SELMODRAFT_411670 [Selaginella moellendorffii]|uniref:Uncharacterized protein n=1 Tax=Selaginella moellendorffii TaxID=88036 RepID=D8RIN4_SELML|nr:hypothetical protein SELMODRAFT_411670 [Selaginella moellendorffii]
MPASDLERFQPQQHWQIFDLITPTYGCDSNTLRRIGGPNDGGKWICGPIRVTGSKCVVFSMGSNNQFDFEEAIVRSTGQWRDRIDESGKTFKRLNTIVRELGVSGLTLLKMDIEHGEYEVFESLKRAPEEFLPDHILVELHTWEYPRTSKHSKDWVKTIIDLVRDIDAMGYSFAFQERTIGCVACFEYVLVRDRPSTINPKGNLKNWTES